MHEWQSWIRLAVAVAGALVIAVTVVAITALVVRSVARRSRWGASLIARTRRPFRALLIAVAVGVALSTTLPAVADEGWRVAIGRIVAIGTIAAAAWFATGLVLFAIDLGLARYRTDVEDNRVARRARTQMLIVRRLAIVVIIVVAAGSILLTFPAVRTVGASLLASAGIASIVAGLAAQSTLANVFAGMQLAFSDAIRVDDVVVVEEQWGRIEEITLTYVVVHLWDDRRLVLPSTYFTSTPFENWTRSTSELLGAVELDLDWRVSPALMREELNAILERTELWDGRAAVLQVTDAVGGFVRVRVLVTAKDAPSLFDLRCFVREELVEWLQSRDTAGLPRTRVELVEAQRRPPSRARSTDTHVGQVDQGLFTGTAEAEQRAADHFTSTLPIVRPEGHGEGEGGDEC